MPTTAPVTAPPSPSRLTPVDASVLLAAVARATAEAPLARKRLVAPTVNAGRELLLALARRTGGWVGWEVVTLRGLADALALVPLDARGVRIGSDVEIDALIGEAFDAALDAKELGSRIAALRASLGFRRVLGDAVLELRAAGIAADALRAAAAPDATAARVVPVLARVERLLAERALTDAAGVFAAALDGFDTEAPYTLDGRTYLMPGLGTRGLAGRLLGRLVAHGATVLDADRPRHAERPGGRLLPDDASPRARGTLLAHVGGAPPAHESPVPLAIDAFVAATPADELREVLRRALAEGRRWDEVEIVATDPDAYGIALDALGQRLGVGATMLHGVPLARTRLGRALDRWLRWIEDGLPADLLRQALEAGELDPPDETVPPTAAARELRRLAVGWGRARYVAAVAALRAPLAAPAVLPDDDRSAEERAAEQARRQRVRTATAALLDALLAALPTEVPERGGEAPVHTSRGALARATLAWLALVPTHDQAERQTAERLTTRLEELAGVADAPVRFASAMAALRLALADLRAWPAMTAERQPWSAAGGMLHLTDLAHAGLTARPRTFVVGLDADRTAGATRPDPLLPDALRDALGADALATGHARRVERAHVVASALAGLRGTVTLSYATQGALDGRETGPAPVLLDAHRLVAGDAAASYEALRAALGAPAGAIPAAVPHATHADARDVWLAALDADGLLLDGSTLVREAFAGLRAGEAARAALQSPVPGAHHGLVPEGAALHAALASGAREISPSSLELLGRCPLAWFYGHALGARLPRDPAYDADRWLDALQRGSLLHEVYEQVGRRFAASPDALLTPEGTREALAIADAIVEAACAAVPPPSETVLRREWAEIRRATLAFVAMERDQAAAGDAGRWMAFERGFGKEAQGEVRLAVAGVTLRLRGQVDRIDALSSADGDEGALRVIDYKTGSSAPYARTAGAPPFDGGRKLQPALYAAAVEQELGRPVAAFEYRFPTEKGGNAIVRYTADELQGAHEVIAALLAHVERGEFIPTTDVNDCGWCESKLVCRVHDAGFGKRQSPRAAWAAEHGAALPLYAGMRQRRGSTLAPVTDDA